MKSTVISIVFILSLAIVAGCVSTHPDYTPTTNPQNNSGDLTYTNESYNFSIKYPANWAVAEGVKDNYTYPAASLVTNVATFYPPHDDSTTYDSFTLALDNNSLYSSLPITLDTYGTYGLKYYYNEIPNITLIDSIMTNISSYPALCINFSYVFDGTKLRGMTLFVIERNAYSNGEYHPLIYRLEYRASEATFDDYLGTARQMMNTFEISQD